MGVHIRASLRKFFSASAPVAFRFTYIFSPEARMVVKEQLLLNGLRGIGKAPGQWAQQGLCRQSSLGLKEQVCVHCVGKFWGWKGIMVPPAISQPCLGPDIPCPTAAPSASFGQMRKVLSVSHRSAFKAGTPSHCTFLLSPKCCAALAGVELRTPHTMAGVSSTPVPQSRPSTFLTNKNVMLNWA